MKISKNKIISLVLGVTVLAGGFFSFKAFMGENYPYRLVYISEKGNPNEKLQKEAINKVFKGTDMKETNFDMLEVDDKGTVVIDQTEYNKLAKEKNLKEVNLTDDETMIIPRYDGLKNKKYLDEQKEKKEFKVKDMTLKVKGVLNNKILITGLFKNQLVVSDKTYDKISRDSKTLDISGYNYEANTDIKNKVASLFKNKLFSISEGDRLFYLIGKDNLIEN
ncbi:Uncharacterised protein [uncultured Clostridium sp.]|nr:Uncharacterised protein [uncultured Clostridium sp.]SCJ07648.1 Uncharacterised protein [uncultured Clostridium sp.]